MGRAHRATSILNPHGRELLLDTALSDDINSLVLGELEDLRDVHSRRIRRSKDVFLNHECQQSARTSHELYS